MLSATSQRDWRGVGIIGLCPLVAFGIAGGNINLLMAAALLAGARGHMGPLALFSLAKLSPALLAMGNRHDLRRFAAWVAIMVAVTLSLVVPMARVVQLPRRSTCAGGRGPRGRRPASAPSDRCRNSANETFMVDGTRRAILLLPVLWWGSLVLLLAPARIWLDGVVG